MDNMQLLDLLNDVKEKTDIINELIKINEHKIYLLQNNNESNNEIETFIREIIDKYRKKLEVKDYYNSYSGKDELDEDRFQLLCIIERMIYNYVLRKIVMNNKLKKE